MLRFSDELTGSIQMFLMASDSSAADHNTSSMTYRFALLSVCRQPCSLDPGLIGPLCPQTSPFQRCFSSYTYLTLSGMTCLSPASLNLKVLSPTPAQLSALVIFHQLPPEGICLDSSPVRHWGSQMSLDSFLPVSLGPASGLLASWTTFFFYLVSESAWVCLWNKFIKGDLLVKALVHSWLWCMLPNCPPEVALTCVPTRRECWVPTLTQLCQHSVPSSFSVFAYQMSEKWCLTDIAFFVVLLKPSHLLGITESDGVLRGKKIPLDGGVHPASVTMSACRKLVLNARMAS